MQIAPENPGVPVCTACQHKKKTSPIPWSAGTMLAGIGQNCVESSVNNYSSYVSGPDSLTLARNRFFGYMDTLRQMRSAAY